MGNSPQKQQQDRYWNTVAKPGIRALTNEGVRIALQKYLWTSENEKQLGFFL